MGRHSGQEVEVLKASGSRGDFSGVQKEMSEELKRASGAWEQPSQNSQRCGAGEPQAEGHAGGGC